MKFLVFSFALISLAEAAIISNKTQCKDWCGGICLDSCQSTLATPICLGDTQCQCLCPTTKANCNQTWCDSFCSTKSMETKFKASCVENNQTCKCQFESKFQSPKRDAKLQPVNITFVADSTLLNAEFKCTQKWCSSYCTLRGEGRKFDANCDKTESCHCQYEQKALPSLSSLASNMKTSTFKCSNEWCSKYCDSKSEGRKFEAGCDESQTCKCQYPKQTFVKASGGTDRSSRNESTTAESTSNKKFKCTDTFCSSYCQEKSNGRKFEAKCTDQEACKCEYLWQPTGKRIVSTSSVSN